MTRPPRETEGDFLSRWSRLKREGQPEPEPEAPAETAPAAPGEPEKTEAEILEELGLPDPETLGPGSDFKAFMAEAVPDFIRRKALRRLWASNPALANLDRLVDYGEDYSDSATVVANLQSAYKAGSGYFAKFAREAEEAEAAKAAAEEGAADAGDAAPAGETESGPAGQAGGGTGARGENAEAGAAGDAEGSAGEAAAPDAPARTAGDDGADTRDRAPAASRHRRMRFDFDDG